ncbi:MAG TPA: PQQ-dependent dehydrogenase, methanol/ethanol family [Gemmatimonadaceae bacterium]|nr:PQQ-dependent dehydrogenase, methanol/ethanol family [Gemmatimonadaceae bacterium]
MRVAARYNQTFDEPAHIAAGMEWLRDGRYDYDPQHPPLARVAAALGPMLDGARAQHRRTMWEEGNAILVQGNHYVRTLRLARLGMLPFLLLLLGVVWAWARWLYDDRTAALAVLLTASMPQILAHSALATTDIPLVATLCWALYAFARWVDRPTARRTLHFGVAGGAALVTKFSSIPFFAVAALLIVIAVALTERREARREARESRNGPGSERDPRANADSGSRRGTLQRYMAALAPYWRSGIAAALVAGLVVWAMYRFHVVLARGFIPVPAPELIGGIQQLAAHNHLGHPSYLFGEISRHGWWYYWPVVLALKTPVAFLSLGVVGVAFAIVGRGQRMGWRTLTPVLGALAVLMVAMLGSIDIGVRHVLPIYPLLAIPAAGAAVALWRQRQSRTVVRVALAALVTWQLVDAARAYPDFLADFNVIAGRNPSRVLVDSNLDWGQDLRELSDTLAARNVSSLSLFYFGTTPVGAFGLADTVRIGGAGATTGWIAASRTYLRGAYAPCFTWLRDYTPVAKIGSSMLLYHILPDTIPHASSQMTAVTSRAEPYGPILGTPDRSAILCTKPRLFIRGAAVQLDDDELVDGSGGTLARGGATSAGAYDGDGGVAGTASVAPVHVRVTDAMLLGAASDGSNWLTYGRDYTNRRYSPLDQIDTHNVDELRLAWVHQIEAPPGGQESSPVVVDGVLYYTGPFGLLIAVDARTGAELWRHQHNLRDVPTCCGPKNRGVAVYGDKVYMSTLDDHVLALDRATGKLIWDVTTANPDLGYSMTSAPLAVDGKIIVGIAGGEFPIRGHVDAYDSESGKRIWRFFTVPSPEEGGWWGKWSPTTPDGDALPRDIAQEKRDSAKYADAWKNGGGGVWNTPSYDPKLGLIYFGVGNPAPNTDASMRPGDNLYTSSIVAIDVKTGKVRWYYQQIPHDMWDYDAASATVLFDVQVNGERVPAVAQAGKVGWVYILDRRTGKRIHRSEGFVPHENTFAAPTPEGVRIMPGMGGGNNNAPPSYSPKTGLMYVSGIVEPILFILAPQKLREGVKWEGGQHLPLAPATGTLTAIDVATGKIRWQKETEKRMLGTGTMTTAGGLLFYGEQQGVFNAADAETGKILWTARTGGRVRAPPITWEMDGRQYVAIAAGEALFAYVLK